MTDNTANLTATNIGGIEQTSVEFTPGLNVLSGPNATNRTSLLLALNSVLGGRMGNVRSGAEEGEVTLEIGGETYTRTLKSDGSISGNPYHDNKDTVDKFVSLIERNPIRQLIENARDTKTTINPKTGREEDLAKELARQLMAPVDFDQIQSEIQELDSQRQTIEHDLKDLREEKEKLPGLEQTKREKEEEIKELEEKVEQKKEELANIEIDPEEEERARELMDELSDARDDRREIESEIEKYEDRIEDYQNEIDRLESNLGSIEDQLSQLSDADEDQIQSLRSQRDQLQDMASLLSDLTTSAQRFSRGTIPEELKAEKSEVTDELDPSSQEVECPLCSQETTMGSVDEQAEHLQHLEEEYRESEQEIENKINKLVSQQDELHHTRRRRDELEQEIANKKEGIEDSEELISHSKDEIKEIDEEIEELEQKVEETEELREKNVVELSQEQSTLTGKLQTAKNKYESTIADIESIEEEIEAEDDLEKEKDELTAEIKDRRERMQSLQESAAEAIRTHMDELLDILDYENIERVDIDLKTSDDPTEHAGFDLRIARKSASGGVIHEQEVQTLSESERSLIGVVVALAGYMTHNIQDEVPFILVDSVEQFDAERINKLLNYVSDELEAEYLVAALLPEDAGAIKEQHQSITADALA